MKFPQYRKYSNNKSYFKITSEITFEEITVIGSKCILTKIEAKTYPEKLFILDLLQTNNEHQMYCSIEEFESIQKDIR